MPEPPSSSSLTLSVVSDGSDSQDKSRRKKRTVQRKRGKGGSSPCCSSWSGLASWASSGSCWPRAWVWTAASSNTTEANATAGGAVEIAVLLALAVVALYLVACFTAVSHLPTAGTPDFAAHMGDNFNVAHPNEWDHRLHPGSHVPAAAVSREDASKSADSLSPPLPPQQKQPQLPPPPQQPPNTFHEVFQQAAHAMKERVPKATWPVTLGPEEMETMTHPADDKVTLHVPKFWSAPIHNGGLMTRETAMKIGTCSEPDAHGNYQRGEECPPDLRTIFVGIASYRDFECRSTAESIFLRAKNPHRIRIAVVDQIVTGEDPPCNAPIRPCDEQPNQALCLYQQQIQVVTLEAQYSIGPVFARHIGYRMYRGEYYATQSDAHVTYTQDWDADIIAQIESTHNEMAVLTTYLTDVQGSIDEDGHSLRRTRPIMCNTYYEGGPQGLHLRHGSQPERVPSVQGTPQLQPWWAAGYSFSRGHFIVNVPYDYLQPMIFQGEEMSIGIRGFTIGYDYYAPERSVCFHHYAVGKNAAIRNKVHHFWENSNRYAGTGKAAMKRLLGIVHMIPEVDSSEWDHTEEQRYGIGNVRTPEKFYHTFGIHVLDKEIEKHLCSFVDEGGRMHQQFTPHLRADGMGIEYSEISFQFKDPRPYDK